MTMIHADNDNDTLSLSPAPPLYHSLSKQQSSMRLQCIGLGQAVTMAYAMALMRAGSDAILFLELLSFSNTVAMTMQHRRAHLAKVFVLQAMLFD